MEKISAAGQYGVQLFFLVSAMTISITYESHIAQFGRSTKSQFAWLIKRFFRIVPLYYFAMFFYQFENYAVYVLHHNHFSLVARTQDILANILFLHTWIPSACNSVVPGGWSIGVEMFFYLLVPFIWMLTPVRRRIFLLGICAITFLPLTLLASRLYTGSTYVADDTYFYYWFPTQAPVFILGLIFYFLYGPKLQSLHIPKITAASFVGFLASLLMALYFGTAGKVAPIVAPTIIAISFIFLIFCLQGWIKSIVVNRFTIFLGRISYSVYIFHFEVLILIKVYLSKTNFDYSWPSIFTLLLIFVTTLVLTSGIAIVSKRIIEDPAIAFGHKLSRAIASHH